MNEDEDDDDDETNKTERMDQPGKSKKEII